VPQPDGYKRWHERVEHMVPLPYFPPNQTDGALQDSARRSPTTPTFQSGVDGVGTGFTGPNGTFSVDSAPPDTVGAVGDTQYVQVVNSGLAVFDKATKNVVYGPVPTNTLWSGFGGQCENDNDGDAVVVYDKAANRWIVSQFAVGATPYLQCVAVSHTSDATGAWYRYSFSYGSVFPDYPKMGVWPDAYYETFNMFNGNSFIGSLLCAYDRASMLTGAAATQQCFQLAKTFGGVLPSDLDGSTAPPAGAPNYMVNFGTNSLNLWKFHVDWANTANTSLTDPTNLAVAAFTPACGGGACVLQPGTHEQLDTLADAPPGLSQLRRSRIPRRQPCRESRHGDEESVQRRALVRDPQSRHDAGDLPAVDIRAGLELSLDGLDRDGCGRGHRPGLQRIQRDGLAGDPLHRATQRRCAEHDAGRNHDH
jgi:hypothetical protein